MTNNVVYHIRRILKHKYLVLQYGLEVGCPLKRLLAHDCWKFWPWNLKEYAKGNPVIITKHYNMADHHWEYYTRSSDCPEPVPYNTLLEMVVDWVCAEMAYEDSDKLQWFNKIYPGVPLHPETREQADIILKKIRRTE